MGTVLGPHSKASLRVRLGDIFLVASSPCVDTTAARVRSRRAAGGRMVACGWPATRPAARASPRLLLLLSSRARSAGSRDDGARARLCCRWGEFVGCRLVSRHGAAPTGWYCVCHLGLGGPLGVLRLTSRFPQALARRPPCERSCKPARRSSVARSFAPGPQRTGLGRVRGGRPRSVRWVDGHVHPRCAQAAPSRFPQALARRPPCERLCKPARRSSVAQSSAPGAATHGFGAGAWRAAALGTLG